MGNGAPQHFVNREDELKFLEEIRSTASARRLVHPKFIQFHGIRGIGKTTVLQKIQYDFRERPFFPIWADASQGPALIADEIVRQVQNFGIEISAQAAGDWHDRSVDATRELLKQGPTVFFIDSLDTENKESLSWIEDLLHRFTEDRGLFFVMASKRMISFEGRMAIARKLKTIPLKPFTRKHCTEYILQLIPGCPEETQNLIYRWTRGYPLAVNMMIEKIEADKLDLRQEKDQQQVLGVIHTLINQGILANVLQDKNELLWYQTMLSLFSVPRRFNLSLMQKLTEKFAEQYKLSSSLGYLDLPHRLNKKADVLAWNQVKAGFSVETPIRPIFLTKLRIEEPAKYKLLHTYLADVNEHLAQEVVGSDRIRYTLDYLYHKASSGLDVDTFRASFSKTMQQIFEEPIDLISQFREEYEKDEELHEEVSTYIDKRLPLELFNKHFAESHWQEAAVASQIDEKVSHLYSFFSYLLREPILGGETAKLRGQEGAQRIHQSEADPVRLRLYDVLKKERDIKTALGEDFLPILDLLIASKPDEQKE